MLNQRWARLASDILNLYEELDREVASFATQSGMHCPPGCGACCLSPEVESAVAEMLPLALLLFQRGEVDATLERLLNGSKFCAQYEAHPTQPDQGRCRNYAQRPLLCRLFGYVGTPDKSGQLRYRACRVLQGREAARIAHIEAEIGRGRLRIPFFAPARERVAEIGGTLGSEVMPINRALLRAIEIVGLSQQLGDQTASERRLSL
jgi:Fe-S-cluster containining protein